MNGLKATNSLHKATFDRCKATKMCYFETELCRPISAVSDDENSPYYPPVLGKENCTYRVIYRLPPKSKSDKKDTKASDPKSKAELVGEVFTWCTGCYKWLATNENPHTKKFHHRFVNLHRTKLNDRHHGYPSR